MLKYKNPNPSVGEDVYSLSFIMEFANKGSLWRMLKGQKKGSGRGDEDEDEAKGEARGKAEEGYTFDVGDVKQIMRYCADL